MTKSAQRALLASIHDVSPRFESQVDLLADTLRPYVGNRFAMLVIPNHWGSSPVRASSAFASRLRGWADCGIEMLLHGLTHRDEARHHGIDKLRARFLTAREGEFLGLSQEEASNRIVYGRALLEDILGRPVTGFVAPAWLYGAGALAALPASGINVAEDHMRVWSPQTGRSLARGPVITWASRSPARLCSSVAAAAVLRCWSPQRALRIAVHPGDASSPALLRSIRKTLAAASTSRVAGSYRDLS